MAERRRRTRILVWAVAISGLLVIASAAAVYALVKPALNPPTATQAMADRHGTR
jgi:hypothetical protein